ncbi:MAG TPA: hypothetical protein VIM73_13100, partial [Polyangiaceae bacterium]
VPTRALVIAGGMSAVVVAVLGLAVLAALIRMLIGGEELDEQGAVAAPSTSAVSAVAAVPLGAPSAALEAAIQGGPAALEQLADRYPTDAGVRIEAARAWVWKKDYARAVAAVGRALEAEPRTMFDERVSAVLFQTAQERASMEATFALLTGRMGPRGAELLWDLAGEAAVKPAVRQRAAAWLRTPSFRKVAPESLIVAADLRTAKTCEAARALLPVAKSAADERSLSQLVAWRKTNGCGPQLAQDCMPCLRQDGLLEEAIAAIRARRTNSAEPR